MASEERSSRAFDAGGELVLGLVAPVGTDLGDVVKVISERAERAFGYRCRQIRLSELLKHFFENEKWPSSMTPAEIMHRKMDLGNKLRERHTRGDVLALAAIQELRSQREAESEAGEHIEHLPRTIVILNQLKRPEEVRTLREIYGPAFYLIGVAASYEQRRTFLKQDLKIEPDEAEKLIKRDEDEEKAHGQQTRKTFQLADVFVPAEGHKTHLWRFLDLIFGYPFHTPTLEEHAMFMAFAASMRSADLSRQVGAVVVNSQGDILGSGANDVPRPGGGQYWPDSDPYKDQKQFDDRRDWVEGYDSNVAARQALLLEIARATPLANKTDSDSEAIEKAHQALKHTSLFNVTEYGRPVHAEVAALMSCARNGVSTLGASLYSTTFPCHNCTKHLVAAGIHEVVYVEPYPKSKALQLHGDAVHDPLLQGDNEHERVAFRPFIGVAARRFITLFSMDYSPGRRLIRKDRSTGEVVKFERQTAVPRVSIPRTSYLDRERVAIQCLDHNIDRDPDDALDLDHGGEDETDQK